MRLKQRKGRVIKRRLFRKFFHPSPESIVDVLPTLSDFIATTVYF
jgi:hypothetical protein